MNNFNFARAGNRSNDQARSTSSMLPSSRSRSLFGFHEFNHSAVAHSFVNSALNSGNGYRGGIATAYQLSGPSGLQVPRRNGTHFNGGLPGPFNSPVPSPLQGFFSAMNPIGLHPHPMQNQVLPQPDSVMLVVASVDEPSASGGQSRQSQQQNGSRLLDGLDGNLSGSSAPPLSPFPSNVSEASSQSSLSSHHSSASSDNSGSRCQCDFCRRCVCHMYCGHHAELRCPVHGLGRGSSVESNASNSSGNRGFGSSRSRFPSNASESSSHSDNSSGSFDSEFDEPRIHSDSCECVTCQFCICNGGGMFTNCVARCAKHGMVRLY